MGSSFQPHRTTEHPAKPCILLIDAFDSFSNNIAALLEVTLDVQVHVVNKLYRRDDWLNFLDSYEAVVLGPGPGNIDTQKNPQDEIPELWRLPSDHLLPVLGICLGFQQLCWEYGGRIGVLQEPRHGSVCTLFHCNESIFEDVGAVEAVRYNSLHVSLTGQFEDCEIGFEDVLTPWDTYSNCPELKPLAWDVGDEDNGMVLMAVEHVSKPFHGLQYHPESICSSKEGWKVIENWWKMAQEWNEAHRPCFSRQAPKPTLYPASISSPSGAGTDSRASDHPLGKLNGESMHSVLTSVVEVAKDMKAQDLIEVFGLQRLDVIMLESAARPDRVTCRFSIIGFLTENRSVRLDFDVYSETCSEHVYTGQGWKGDPEASAGLSNVSIWDELETRLGPPHKYAGNELIPFWGGYVGYITYEMGLYSLAPEHARLSKEQGLSQHSPDVSFVYIERSIVIDHHEGTAYVQSLHRGDASWIQETTSTLKDFVSRQQTHTSPPTPQSCAGEHESTVSLEHPDDSFNNCCYFEDSFNTAYQTNVELCRDWIRRGESYELCLTTQKVVKVPQQSVGLDSWDLYKTLSATNPAPFCAYLQLGPACIVSASPERFLSWDRRGKCQMRPIKGTVRKEAGMTRAKAEELLLVPKEIAENLMIVDLIRHDLHGVAGSAAVTVKELMKVEEYETVFQLVSVIEAQLQDPRATSTVSAQESSIPFQRPTSPTGAAAAIASSTSPAKDSTHATRPATGVDVLAASLPPGSMTGAPKKRTCEILAQLEEHNARGIYSGVLGYLSVGGGGDFSVVIRSATKCAHECTGLLDRSKLPGRDGNNLHGFGAEERVDIWRIGSGGAVTILSSSESEHAEMQLKAEVTLDALKKAVDHACLEKKRHRLQIV
ncbi:MAG: hypothetical protein M1825_003091 [Sarcosagium campestre]|nr:MAG: hypothetical protein M1825_003091 [Sarcosagium campestre]